MSYEDSADYLIAKVDENIYTNLDSTYTYGQKLLRMGVAHNDSFLIGDAYSTLAYTYYYKNELTKALTYLDTAARVYKALNHSDILGMVEMDYGNIYSDMGYLEKCLTHYQKAERLLTEYSEYPEDLATLYFNMVTVFMDLGDDYNLEKYISKTREIVESEEISYLVAPLKNIEAQLAILENQYSRAALLAEDALSRSREVNDLIEQINSLEILGKVQLHDKNTDEGLRLLDSALVVAKLYGDPATIGIQQAQLSQALLQSGFPEKALKLSSEAFSMGMSQPSLINQMEVSKVYARVLEANGSYKEALSTYKIYEKVKDSIAGFELSEKILRSKNRISEQQNKILTSEAGILKANNSRNRIVIFATSIALMLSVALIILMVLNIRNRKAAEKALREKQTQLDQKTRELEDKNRELVQMDAGKNKLLSIISHDLREPFNQIISFIQILEGSAELDENLRDIINHIKDSTDNTIYSMKNLLLWSKSQFMNLHTEAEKIDLKDLIGGLEAEMSASLKTKKLKLNIEVEEDAELLADRFHVEIIIRNLLSNAIKFSPAGSNIDLRAKKLADGVDITVRDQGKGMSHEEIENLFDTEKHFSTTGTFNEKGTGLGMLIVHEFVKENKGSIDIESEENKGSTFRVRFPAA